VIKITGIMVAVKGKNYYYNWEILIGNKLRSVRDSIATLTKT